MEILYGVAGDTGFTVGVQLSVLVDGVDVPVDLSSAQAIECRMTDEAGEVTTIPGLVGDDEGRVTTELPTLVVGRFTLQWRVTESDGDFATYPGPSGGLVPLVVREEAV